MIYFLLLLSITLLPQYYYFVLYLKQSHYRAAVVPLVELLAFTALYKGLNLWALLTPAATLTVAILLALILLYTLIKKTN